MIIIQKINCRWDVSDEEKDKYIKALTSELTVLRAKVGVPQDELARIIGVSRQTYGDVERRVRAMSWSTYLSLILFFDNHTATHTLIRSMPAFPYELFSRFNEGNNPGDLNLDKFIGITDESIVSKLDEQALYTVRTVMMVEYARCTGVSSDAVIKSFDGRRLSDELSDKNVLIRQALMKIKGSAK